MGHRGSFVFAASLVTVASLGASVSHAHRLRANRESTTLELQGGAVGRRTTPTAGPHAGSRGSTVAADGHGLLVTERNAGALVRTDRQGKPIASLQLHEGVAQLVHDGAGSVFVADRRADEVVRVDASKPDALEPTARLRVPEPYGLALTPDGSTLLVTSVADHALVAIDTQTLQTRWQIELAAEPRGVAVSSDGGQAVVGFVSSGALAVVDLRSNKPRVSWRGLDPRDHVKIEEAEGEDFEWDVGPVAVVAEARSRFQVPTDSGRRQARSTFAVGYVGHDLIVAPHQLSTPQMKRIPSADLVDSYGGGPQSVPAIVHRLAILDAAEGAAFASLPMHQPRAFAYDLKRDTLFVGGYGDDRLAAVADVSQPSPYLAWTAEMSWGAEEGPDQCGIDGLSVDGDHVWVHCEITRRLFRLEPERFDVEDKPWRREKNGVHVGPELAASLRSPEVERGAELFRRGDDVRISDSGTMACSSCHPEGRQDGLSWRLGRAIVQTPMLAGRIVGTAPYKWSGTDADLHTSFRHTIERLGGSEGWKLSQRELSDLAAYVESLPAPRPPTVASASAVARGKALFHDELDCGACHDGQKLTDGLQHPLASRGLEETDTPSLIGLAHTAPYYHDGSAVDLRTLLTDRGNVHDMSDMSGLSEDQIADLIAYLQSI